MALTDAEARKLFALKVARFRLKLAKLRAKRVRILVHLARSGGKPPEPVLRGWAHETAARPASRPRT